MAAIAPIRPLRPPAWVRWTAVACWFALIFFMSAQSDSGDQSGTVIRTIFQVLGLPMEPAWLEAGHHLLRKAAHFTEFAVMAALLWWALPWRDARRLAVAWAGAVAVAATDEFHQAFVPNRGPAVTDVGIDAAGALFAVLVIALLGRLRR